MFFYFAFYGIFCKMFQNKIVIKKKNNNNSDGIVVHTHRCMSVNIFKLSLK